MSRIDERLLDCDTKPQIEENFNRALGLIDGAGDSSGDLAARVEQLESELAQAKADISAAQQAAEAAQGEAREAKEAATAAQSALSALTARVEKLENPEV